MQSHRRKPEVQEKVHCWYVKKKDDAVFQIWTEACSDKHNDCLNCPLVVNCQDLVDRLIDCMDMPAPSNQEIALEP